ncbi:MAG: hypothetical protein NT058_00085, partial [Candidatus Portnoybacteria bacterium]|nr:hypothetical protein [Candidatus Portnoybacteria bacterium]
ISGRKLFITILVVIALLALAFVVYFVLPRAQVVISPKREKVQFKTNIIADRDVNSTNIETSEIAGQVFETEKIESREFPSTGERDVLEKAKGKVTIYNQYSSSPQTLVKTTRLKSPDGKIFRLTSTITVPGAVIDEGKIIASSKEVEVEADEAGTTQSDIAGAIEIVTLELKDKALQDFKAIIPADLKLLSDAQSLSVVESSSSIQANQPGEKFTVSVKVKMAGIAFKENDALSLIEKSINNEALKSRTLLFSTIQVTYKTLKLDLKQGFIELDCDVAADSIASFDEQKIKDDLAGKNETDVRKYLSSLPDIETAKVIFWPFWVKKVPTDRDKIKVITKIN